MSTTAATASRPRADRSRRTAAGADEKKEDGRTLRSATTRRAVAEAYLDLLEEGDPRPTARSIAARANVSERAVFRHFQDMETLFHEAAALQIERVTSQIPELAPASGSLDGRIDALAQRWCTINERVSPVRRVALLQEPFSPEIARRLAWVRGVARNEIETALAPEIARTDEPSRARVIAALSAAMSWETWNELRKRNGLDPDAALGTVTSMIASFLQYVA